MELADVEKWRVSNSHPTEGYRLRMPRIWHQCVTDSLDRDWIYLSNGRQCSVCHERPPQLIKDAALLVGVPGCESS